MEGTTKTLANTEVENEDLIEVLVSGAEFLPAFGVVGCGIGG